MNTKLEKYEKSQNKAPSTFSYAPIEFKESGTVVEIFQQAKEYCERRFNTEDLKFAKMVCLRHVKMSNPVEECLYFDIERNSTLNFLYPRAKKYHCLSNIKDYRGYVDQKIYRAPLLDL